MGKMPRKYKRFDKMSDIAVATLIYKTWNLKMYWDEQNQEYVVYTYFGRSIYRTDTKSKMMYLLDLFEKKF